VTAQQLPSLVCVVVFATAFSAPAHAQYFQQGPKISLPGTGGGLTVGLSGYGNYYGVLSGSPTELIQRNYNSAWGLPLGWRPGASAAATISSDGRTVAMVRNVDGGAPQIVIDFPVGGKEAIVAGSGFSASTVPYEWSIALSSDGSTCVVGNPYDGGGVYGVNHGIGAVWVFAQTNGFWSQQGPKLVGSGYSGTTPGEGYSVAISANGNSVLIGGPFDGNASSANGTPGAAWVFTRANGVWTQQGPKLTTASGGQFGSSVGLSSDGNTAMGGAPGDLGGVGSGTVFTSAAGVWIQGPTFSGTGAVGNAAQGLRGGLSADGSTVVLSGPYDGAGTPGPYGSAWVFRQTNGVWTQQGPKVRATDAVGDATHVGMAVAVASDGNVFILGSPEDNQSKGAGFVFALPHFKVITSANAFVGEPTSVTVQAVDSTGYPISGYSGTLHLSSTDPLATLPASVKIGADPVTFTVTLHTAGPQNISAADAEYSSITGASLAIQATPPVTRFSITAPSQAYGGQSIPLTITALDQFGNVAPGYNGTVSVSSGDPLFYIYPSTVKLTKGVAQTGAMFHTTGSWTVDATDVASAAVTGSSSLIRVTVLPPARINLSRVDLYTRGHTGAGEPVGIQVVVSDSMGDILPNYMGRVRVTSSDPQALLPPVSQLQSGPGSVYNQFVTVTLYTAGVQTVTVTDDANPSLSATLGFYVDSGAPSRFAITAPASAPRGVPFSVSVTSFDPFNNAYPSYHGGVLRFTSTDSQATLPDGSSPNADGTYMVTLRTPGVQSIAVTEIVAPTIIASANVVVANPPSVTPSMMPAPLTMEHDQGVDPANEYASLLIGPDLLTTWTASTSAPWLKLDSVAGSTPAAINITPVPSALANAGPYQTTLVFSFGSGTTVTVPVQLTYSLTSQLSLSVSGPLQSQFSTASPLTVFPLQGLFIQATPRNAPVDLSVTGVGGSWLTVTPSSGVTPLQAEFQVAATGLAPGTYGGEIVITAEGVANGRQVIPIGLTVGPKSIPVSAFVNAANRSSGIAANTIVSAFGSFPDCRSAQASVDTAATSVFYSSINEIDFLMPPAVAGEQKAAVTLTCGDMSWNGTVTLTPVAPAVFTRQQYGEPTTVISGENAALYVTGFGLLGPPGADGLPRLVLPVTAVIGGLPATITYAGEAPGFTSGLQQINIAVPLGLERGTTVPLQLTVGGVTVSLSVQVL
jgi:uncharacterized protein (TIGR03437 family)